jgi:hypothetical protein
VVSISALRGLYYGTELVILFRLECISLIIIMANSVAIFDMTSRIYNLHTVFCPFHDVITEFDCILKL